MAISPIEIRNSRMLFSNEAIGLLILASILCDNGRTTRLNIIAVNSGAKKPFAFANPRNRKYIDNIVAVI